MLDGVLGCAHGDAFQFAHVGVDHLVRDFLDHIFEHEAEVATCAEISRRDVAHTVCMGGQLVTLLERCASGVFWVVNGDGVSAVLSDDCEAGHIGGAVPDIDHVSKRNGADGFWHVVINVLVHGEETFIDAEEVLGFLGMGDDAFGKADATGFVF